MNPTPALLDYDTHQLRAIAESPLYGYSKTHPIPVGGVAYLEGPLNEHRVLNALLGPKDELVDYHRRGSLKAYGMENCKTKEAMLDAYEVSWKGLAAPKVLYFNMYEAGS